LRDAAKLMERGARFVEIQEWVFRTVSLPRIRLLGHCLSQIESLQEGHIHLLTVTLPMLAETGAQPSESENFVNYALEIEGTRVAALLQENHAGWKISLRSRGEARVDTLARALGGGGHPNAAGCTLTGTQAEARARLLEEMDYQGLLTWTES